VHRKGERDRQENVIRGDGEENLERVTTERKKEGVNTEGNTKR